MPRTEAPPDAGAAVEARDLAVRFGDAPALDGLDLSLAPGTLTALLGPSGCGKSTTLSVLAGLRLPDRGTVLLDGADVTDVAPERRPVGLVLQKPLLFPHLTVARNIAFGLRMQRVPRAEARAAVDEMLARVHLEGLGHRRPHELSGGQEQRVSLARALVRRPRVLLLDEPFSQLDPDLRAEMRSLLRELQAATGVTTLLVTHDRAEAVDVAGRVAVLLDGRIEGEGTPRQLWTSPPTLAAARFLGVGNEVRGRVASGIFRADAAVGGDEGDLVVAADGAGDGPAVLLVRPEAVELRPGGDRRPGLRLPVKATRFAGDHILVDLSLPDGRLLCAHVLPGSEPRPGDRVAVRVPAEAATVLPDRGEEGAR